MTADATVTLRVEIPADLFGGAVRALRAPFADGRGEEIVARVRKSIDEEFSGAFFKAGDGGSEPWAPRWDPFGTRKPGPPLGGPGGALAQAWAGGSGGYEEIESERIEIGVDDEKLYPGVHRGGAGDSIDLFETTNIRAKEIGDGGIPTMFWALGLGFGVWIRPAKLVSEGLNIPARPHAGASPDVVEAASSVLREAFES